MSALTGLFLVPTAKNPDTGLWLIFHHESEGILAFDVTKAHPDIPLRHFEAAMDNAGARAAGSTVLLGGPEQADSAVLILHNNPQHGGGHRLGEEFAFLSYRFVLLPGLPPQLQHADETPTRVALGHDTEYLVVMGFRLWDMDVLEAELKDWQWSLLPASAGILFRTKHEDRLAAAQRTIN